MTRICEKNKYIAIVLQEERYKISSSSFDTQSQDNFVALKWGISLKNSLLYIVFSI